VLLEFWIQKFKEAEFSLEQTIHAHPPCSAAFVMLRKYKDLVLISIKYTNLRYFIMTSQIIIRMPQHYKCCGAVKLEFSIQKFKEAEFSLEQTIHVHPLRCRSHT
jgi:hypothetical protein